MRARAENYKGIDYVQISTLPADQRKHIFSSFNRKLIINILKGEALLNDCLQYSHYVTWYENVFLTFKQIEAESAEFSLVK